MAHAEVMPPVGLTADDWKTVRAEVDRNRHAASATAEGYRARNVAQEWTTLFDGRGFLVRPDHGKWLWGLELESYGYSGTTAAVSMPEGASNDVERIAYDWGGGLEEWFINDSRGLEHGFTLHTAPAGAGDALELNLGVRGGLTAQNDGGRSVRFVNAAGLAVVTYSGLKAWDADGKDLEARMESVSGTLRITVDVREARYPVTIDPVALQAYFKASNTDASDDFGAAVAISGDTLAVGAPREDSDGVGVNPDRQADDSLQDSGAVYIFQRVDGIWSQQAYLKASNTGAGDRFGNFLAMSGDTLVVGAPGEDGDGTGVNPSAQADNSASGSGAVYVFQRSGGIWTQQAYIKASNTDAGDLFGSALAVSGDTLAVGAYEEASNGTGVNPAAQGDNSATRSGAVYVFERSVGVWAQQAYIKASNTDASDAFGFSVALSGGTLAVGAVFERNSATGVNPSDESDNSAFDAGAAYVFRRNAGVWSQQAYIKASNTDPHDNFGTAVALEGDILAVGASVESSLGEGVNPDTQGSNLGGARGAVYVFHRAGDTWEQEAFLKGSILGEDRFYGRLVAMSGNVLSVAELGVGTVFAYERVAGSWVHRGQTHAPHGNPTSTFARALAVSGATVVAGAWGESSNGTGVNPPTLFDNSANDSGAAYAFTIVQPEEPQNIGVYRSGEWLLDSNGSGAFEPESDADFAFGFGGATPITGDWNGDGRAKAGLFANGFWFLDYDGDGFWDGGTVDKQYAFGWAGVTPLVGDWNGDGSDEIGIFINGFWYLDADGNGVWDGSCVDTEAEFGWAGVTPRVGDWNAGGSDKIGIFINGFWFLDYNGNASWDGSGIDRQAEFGWAGVTPLVGDWNADGRDKIGIFTNGFWFLDGDGSGEWSGPTADFSAHFGFAGATTVIGDWNGDGRDKVGVFSDGDWLLDYDGSRVFDGGINDKVYVFGQTDDIPLVGRW